ncbi:MAG: RNA polymerase sigma factor [Vicinamibacterales bacterium]
MTKGTKENPSKQVRQGDRDDEYVALLESVQSGNRDAMERLLMRAQEVAYRFSQLVCGRADDADDAMQEALLKTYRYAARIRQPEAFRTWLYRTVKNACLIGRRKRVEEPRRLLSLDEVLPTPDGRELPVEVADPGRGPEQIALNRALGRRLNDALGKLPAQYRLVVFLREVEGLSTREVAKVTGISEANVKTRLHRARLFLRQELEKP